ncbi:MAG: toll/interleukin-1 receptor domain-containing protein [Armatimonadota bacterium]
MSAVNAFISYSHADEKDLERLRKHMAMLQREGSISAWTDRAVLPGTPLDGEIDKQLQNSALFIALLSPDYIASGYCYDKEFEKAQALHEAGKLRIVPVILEPCDWLNTPFRNFMALPKDGKAVSNWTNQNTAYLDVVTGLRGVLQASASGSAPVTGTGVPSAVTVRRPRVKQDFDSIQKSDFADKAYDVIQNYFRASCDEINSVGDTLRAKFERMSATAFTCTVVNRAKIRGGEAHITVTNAKGRYHFGNISYIYAPHSTDNSSNGSYNVEADDYNLFLTPGPMAMLGGRDEATKLSPEQAAENLWNAFVKQTGIEYE